MRKFLQKIKLTTHHYLLIFFLAFCINANGQIVLNELPNGAGSLVDVINLAPENSTITFLAGVETILLTDEIEIDKNITLDATLVGEVTLDASSLSRIFNVTSGSLTLTNIIMVNGEAEDGGAIFINNTGSVTVNSGQFMNNDAVGVSGSGGAVYVDAGGYFEANETMFSNNTAIRAGGAIEDNSGPGLGIVLNDVTISSNTAMSSPGNGGGLHITGAGDAMIEGGIVSNNTASAEGGGLWNGTGLMTVVETTISGNVASGAEADQGGGGIFNAGGTLDITGAIISDNSVDGAAGSGGGILNDLGSMTIVDTEISGNSSIRAGGGIEENSVEGSLLTLTNVTLDANTTMSSPGNGGGLHITGAGDAMIEGGIVSNNTASAEGGGLWNGTGIMTVVETQIMGNVAMGTDNTNGGGGVFNAGGDINIMATTIANNTTTGSTSNGGGLFNDGDGNIFIEVSTISTNSTEADGGGIYTSSGNVEINASTIAFNEAQNGGGVSSDSEVTLSNTIVANNEADSGADVNGQFTSEGYNLISFDPEDNFEEMDTDIIGMDPVLGELAANGGVTMTHSLENGSPAFDAGDPELLIQDQRGFEVFNDSRDIGAYEAQVVLVATDNPILAETAVSISPNPTSNFLEYIDLDNNSIEQISIRNNFGQTVKMVQLGGQNSGRINVSEIPSGNYYIIFKTENGSLVKKFVKI